MKQVLCTKAKLKDIESSKAALEKLFVDMVRKICSVVKNRFEDLRRNLFATTLYQF